MDAFVNDLKTTDSVCITSPPGFAADAWSCYVQAISSSSYYLSMDELLLVCQCAKQNVIVYIQEGSGLRYAGSWLRGHGNTLSVKLAFDPLSRRGHFERVLPASALVNQPASKPLPGSEDDSQLASKPLPGNDDALARLRWAHGDGPDTDASGSPVESESALVNQPASKPLPGSEGDSQPASKPLSEMTTLVLDA